MLAGLALACAGNLFMLIWPTLVGVVIGRLVVGLGVGMVASAGTAWAADQHAAKGAARAGVVLTGGFAIGPVVTALLTTALPGRAGIVAVYDDEVRGAPFVDGRRIGPALIAALPMGLWVFACVISAVMVFTGRIGDRFSGRMSPVTFALTAVILGCAYGLCLGQGLQDVERLAPRDARGLVTGLFYVVSYSASPCPSCSTPMRTHRPVRPARRARCPGPADRGRSAGGRRAERAGGNNVARQVRLTTTPPLRRTWGHRTRRDSWADSQTSPPPEPSDKSDSTTTIPSSGNHHRRSTVRTVPPHVARRWLPTCTKAVPATRQPRVRPLRHTAP